MIFFVNQIGTNHSYSKYQFICYILISVLGLFEICMVDMLIPDQIDLYFVFRHDNRGQQHAVAWCVNLIYWVSW